jgi:trimethylamine-N-oxide reductase cytochrome c-type subunit TorC
MAKADGAERMKKGLEAGETCISCHKGIAHKLPDMSQGYRSMLKEIAVGAAKAKPGKGDAVISYKTGALFADVANATPDAAGEGKLLAATQAKVIDSKGDWLKVRIDGWQQEGAERVIYALRGQRILSAALGPELVEKLQREAPAEDPETGLVWAKVSLDAWVARANVTAEQAPLWAYGDELYRASCGTCHNLPPPGHTLANQWSGTLNAMKRFISIDDEEYRFLLKYLQFNAKDTGGKDHG